MGHEGENECRTGTNATIEVGSTEWSAEAVAAAGECEGGGGNGATGSGGARE